MTVRCATDRHGCILGWAAALMKAPGLSTYLGGALLLTATVIVILSANHRVRIASESAKAMPKQSQTNTACSANR